MELVKVGEKTYYIKNATNIGIYKIDETQVYLIDTGNDKDAGKKILKFRIELTVLYLLIISKNLLQNIQFWNHLFFMVVIHLKTLEISFY